MASYELFPAKGVDNQVVARFGGLGRITFEFDTSGKIVHEHEEIEDSSVRGSAVSVFGRGRVENARAAACEYYAKQVERTPPSPEPRTQTELNF